MRENKLCVKVTAIAEASRSSGQSIILRYGGLSSQWHNAIVAAGGVHYINRDGRLRFLRAN